MESSRDLAGGFGLIISIDSASSYPLCLLFHRISIMLAASSHPLTTPLRKSSHSLSHTHPLSPPIHTHTHTPSLSLSASCSLSRARAPPLHTVHTRIHTHTLLSLPLPLSRSHRHSHTHVQVLLSFVSHTTDTALSLTPKTLPCLSH